jgi:predicted ATPase
MSDSKEFKRKVKACLKTIAADDLGFDLNTKPKGSPHAATLGDLAEAICLNYDYLNQQLNGRAVLTCDTAFRIIKYLVERGALTTRSEVKELLWLAGCSISSKEWERKPLVELEEGPEPNFTPPIVEVSSSKEPEFPAPILPIPLTSFVGRESELVKLKAWLTDDQPGRRLVTLTGLSGCGKTRLALQAAYELVAGFKHGTCWVDLSFISDPSLVAFAIATSLQIKEDQEKRLAEKLKHYLRDKHLLLVLDNFEQVTTGTSLSLVKELLQAAPHLKVIVTSLKRLNIQGEKEFVVLPLEWPANWKDLTSYEQLSCYPAIKLFIARAEQTTFQNEKKLETTQQIAAICEQFSGIPLAIELVAANLERWPTLQALQQALTKDLDVIAGGPGDLPDRHRSLKAALNWNYTRLNEAEKSLLRRSAAFVGGWEVEAAQSVCNAFSFITSDVADDLFLLFKHSLLQQQASGEDSQECRYTMLGVVRRYALLRLHENEDEANLTIQAHVDYYLKLAENTEKALQGDKPRFWLERLERELPNLRAVLSHLLEKDSQTDTQQLEKALRLAGALGRFWRLHGYLSEGYDWLKKALNAAELHCQASIVSEVVLAKAFKTAGALAYDKGNTLEARTLFEQSLSIWRKLGNAAEMARLLNNLGIIAREQEHFQEAIPLYEEALLIFENLNDKETIPTVLNNLGLATRDSGDLVKARILLEKSLAQLRVLDNRLELANTLSSLGDVALDQADYSAARIFLKESLEIYLEAGANKDLVKKDLVHLLIFFASLAAKQAQTERAIYLAGAAEALRRTVGLELSEAEQNGLNRRLETVHQAVNATSWEIQWQIGLNLPLTEVVAYAREV